MSPSGIIYQYDPKAFEQGSVCPVSGSVVFAPVPSSYRASGLRRLRLPGKTAALGALLLLVSLGGLSLPFYPKLSLTTAYKARQIRSAVVETMNPPVRLPPAAPILFDPLKTETGETIQPINTDFAIVIPKISVNSAVIPSVNPLDPKEYSTALKKGVAHASTSYLPDQDGTVYLFSHSTNYEWFVRDLNAVFYLVKNLEPGDLIVLFYKGKRYTYEYSAQEIVKPRDTATLVPQTGQKRLVLQTCWPPGSVAQRLLIFADLIEEDGKIL